MLDPLLSPVQAIHAPSAVPASVKPQRRTPLEKLEAALVVGLTLAVGGLALGYFSARWGVGGLLLGSWPAAVLGGAAGMACQTSLRRWWKHPD